MNSALRVAEVSDALTRSVAGHAAGSSMTERYSAFRIADFAPVYRGDGHNAHDTPLEDIPESNFLFIEKFREETKNLHQLQALVKVRGNYTGFKTFLATLEQNLRLMDVEGFSITAPGGGEEAQEMTVKLQTRLKQIIENATGGRVMGIGLEGGLAPYVEKAEGDLVPEQRVWR